MEGSATPKADYGIDPETCEDRNYRCCETDNTPADGRDTAEWYDRHVVAWENAQ